ncbi:related to ubiquitin-specific proteinase UBP1 [Cephalotrichum gorgonifer]|uniref:ubiquitinyl hydrolase 1 n=1 Tax=Cephalotrichum gorgonifer TaxID=2041049 RepID=A0AAE8SZE4_9PEZI|nr:related to ubiquitin-specific proteinase UBP1 [Cephalotrichum gorgonifer]
MDILNRQSLPALVTGLVLLVTLAISQAHTLARQLHALACLVWDCAIALTPAFLIHALDKWMNPPMFPGLPSASPPRTHAEKSERMAALLGTNKAAGVLRSFSSGFPRSFPSSPLRGGGLLSFGATKDQPPGLGNLDNSCYQNSILQGLASLDHLPPYLDGHLRGSHTGAGLKTAKTLQDLISKLKDAENNGRTLWTPGVLKNMCSFMQQDAQEYYSKLLDEIDMEIIKAGATSSAGSAESVDSASDDRSLHSDDSGYSSSASVASKLPAGRAPPNPLEGLLAQRVACVQCGHSEGLSLIPFNCLTINLGLNTPGHDLYERLDAYTNLEAIEGVECPRCTLLKLQRLLRTLATRFRESKSAGEHLERVEARLEVVDAALEEDMFDDETMREKCKVTPESKVSVVKTKQAVVARAPKSLAIHVNRSVFDERTGMLFKNPAAVQFPTTLDLGPWCLGSRGGRGVVDGASGSVEEEKWILEPRISMVAGENGKSLVSGPIYELRAVVTHYGHHNNGHYICYRKHTPTGSPSAPEERSEEKDDVEDPEDEQVEDADDATWWRLSDESVRKVSEELVMAQGGVFMLFYDCVDSNLVRTGEEDPGAGQSVEEEKETLVGDGPAAPSLDGTATLSSTETLRVDDSRSETQDGDSSEETSPSTPGDMAETPGEEKVSSSDVDIRDEAGETPQSGP